MCPPPASTTVSTRDLNALTDLDTSAASKDMATDVMDDLRASTELWWVAQASPSNFPYR
ncbi:Hypothetical protein FKW44_002948 [Caligus rogercresseyi]|uniref:Uncharacterized protein n=1 Tax=Caligus rogercresseyi TaxID=217165 RepID=A0A7T8KKW2_CALRO|nr:Hypothetical protein FKW44_002948 [Caligus rogercresseyi]